MKGSPRKSGIDIIGDVSWGTHFCQFYQTKEDLLNILIPYFKAGLENNEFCLWMIPHVLETKEAKEALKQFIPDIDIYLEKGQLEIVPYTQGAVDEGIFDSKKTINYGVKKLNQALENGYEGLRTAGNTSGLKNEDLDSFVGNEKKRDTGIGKRKIISLSQYFLDTENVADIIDVAFNNEFVLIKKEGKWERIKNSIREEITSHMSAGDIISQEEQPVGIKPKNTPSTFQKIDNLELANIIDFKEVQSLMEDLCKLANIPIGIIDLKGTVLISVGWQDICTRFHRIHPETCRHCLESDTELSTGILPGDFKPYRCKNNMWDIATPIIVEDQHVGNIFLGQFFFEDEPLDYELFRSQAKKYGFNEEEYIEALEKVPRLSRETVDTIMFFFMKLANMLSKICYSNIKLIQSLAERDSFVDILKESEEKYRNLIETASEGIWILDAEARTVYVNEKMTEMLGYSQEEMIDKFAWDFADEEGKNILRMNFRKRRRGINQTYEFKLICKDGTSLWVLISAKAFFNKKGKFIGSLGMFTDIAERKRTEEMLAFERSQLLSIFDGIEDIVYVTDPHTYKVLYANKAMKEKFGGKLIGGICYREFQRRDSPCDFCTNQIILKERDKPYNWEFYNPTVKRHFMITDRIIKWPDGRDVRFEIAKDITKRKRIEEALRLSNLYNRSLIEASLDPLVTIGHNGKITDVNGATELVTGYLRNELIGTDFSNYFTEPEKAHAGYQQVFTDGKVRDYPLEIRHKEGHITPVLYNASVYKDENEGIIGVFAAARDITERMKVEEALKKVHDNLEKIVEERTAELERAYNSLKESKEGLSEAQKMAHIGNWEWDIATDKTYWSEEIYSIFGRSPQKAGATYKELLNYIHPEDRERMNNAHKKALNGTPYNIEYMIIREDGEERTVNMQSRIICDRENIPIRLKGITQDITERKIAEEKIQILANVVESSNDAIVTESLEGTITSWNKAAEQIYGYSAEEVLGRSVSLLEPDMVKGEIKYYSEKIKQGKKVQHYETLRLKKDGSVIDISVTLSPILNTSGELVALSAIVRDITERKKTEKALAEMDRIRIKEIHHRIKNNLQVVSSLLDLQAEKFDNEKVREAFREGQNRVVSMSLIHEELYKGKGNDTLNFSAYLRKLAENLFQTYSLSSKNISLILDLEEDAFFNMDTAVPLGIIVNELVSNSLKHAFNEGEEGEVRIKLCREDKKNEVHDSTFSLIILDNGKGIPEDIELERLESLGLQLVRALVDQLDGKIEIKRVYGTEFRIIFNVEENHKPG